MVGFQKSVKEGNLSPADYAKAVIGKEAEGIVNQIVVASELKIDFGNLMGKEMFTHKAQI